MSMFTSRQRGTATVDLALARRVCALIEAGVEDHQAVTRPGKEPRREAQGMLRLDKGVGYLDGPYDHQQLRVVCFDKHQELIDEDAVLDHLVVDHPECAASAGERV